MKTRRKELMIISIDKPVLNGLNAEDLKENGDDARAWPAIEKAHLDKIRATLTLISNET